MKWLVTIFIFVGILLLAFEGHCQPLRKADSLKDVENFEKAIIEYTNTLKQTASLTRLDSANGFLRRGICYYNTNNYKLGLSDYFTALHIFESLGNKERTAAARYNLSIIFLEQKNFKEAENSLTAAEKLYTYLNDSSKLALVYNDLACVYREEGKYADAILLHNKALDNFPAAMDAYLLSKHLYNKGNCFEKSNSDSCIFYYYKAEEIAQTNGDSSLVAVINISIGDIHKARENYTGANANFEKALAMDAGYLSKEELNSLYANLADLYDSLKIYDKAYYYSKKERELNEELYNTEKLNFAAELSEKYESGKKDEKIQSQETENKLKTRNLLLSLIGLGLVAALAAISFINYKRKQKANKVLQLQNDRIDKLNKELDASNQVKSKLFSVISHDIRGPISSIYAYLQMQNIAAKSETNTAVSSQTEQLLETLEDLLVWSKSQLHQFIPSAENVFLLAAITQVTSLQQAGINEKQLLVKNEVPENFVLHTDINMLTIILRNILGNAIKYSLPGKEIKITAAKQEHCNTVSITNETDAATAASLHNFETPSVNSTASGLGFTLIKEFAEKLGGAIHYHYSANTVAAIISLPSA